MPCDCSRIIPGSVTRADVRNPRHRFWNVYKFVIAYRPDKEPLIVARVVHGARDFRRLFR